MGNISAITCPECSRRLRRPRKPRGASPELKAFFEASARVCLWCSDKNLLAGGFEPAGVTERWQGTELRRLRDEAADLRRERLKPKRRRRLEAQRAPAQGALVA